MFDLVIGYGCLTVAAIMYIADKVVETIQIRRHRKNKMAPQG